MSRLTGYTIDESFAVITFLSEEKEIISPVSVTNAFLDFDTRPSIHHDGSIRKIFTSADPKPPEELTEFFVDKEQVEITNGKGEVIEMSAEDLRITLRQFSELVEKLTADMSNRMCGKTAWKPTKPEQT